MADELSDEKKVVPCFQILPNADGLSATINSNIGDLFKELGLLDYARHAVLDHYTRLAAQKMAQQNQILLPPGIPPSGLR